MHHKFKRMLAFLAIAIVASFGIVAVSGSPALAAGPCPADALCFYNTGNGTDLPFIDHDDADTSPGECFTMGSAHRNITSYVRNNTDHQWTAFININCTNTSGPLYAMTSGYMSGIYNNNIESYRRVG